MTLFEKQLDSNTNSDKKEEFSSLSKAAEEDTSMAQARIIPNKDTWQDYRVWRINVMKGGLVISFHGLSGAILFFNKKTIQEVFGTIEIESRLNQNGRITYDLQDVRLSNVLRAQECNAGTANADSFF